MGNAVEKEEPKEGEAELHARLLEAFDQHKDFAKIFLDAFVLLDRDRKILKYNQMFLTSLGVRPADVRKARSIDELVTMEIQSSSQTPIDLIMASTTPQRIDEVVARSSGSEEGYMQLILGSYPFLDADGRLLGTCVLMRDVTAETNLQSKFKERTLQSITDPLTGLFTRRYFEDWIDREVERCRQLDQVPTVGILMFDLDKFKSVNDKYGHQAGDFVLSETAAILKKTSRKSDILGRYGGEELLVLLLGTSAPGSCAAAEKFRAAIQNHEYVYEGQRIPVTTSVGVSMFLTLADTREAVVARADRCLYSAKHAGRNTVFANFGEGEKPGSSYLPAKGEDTSS